MAHRLLFASTHSYLDPSSGAALATRELLELLAARGWDCRAFTCGVLDYQNETPLEDVLGAIERPAAPVAAALSLGGHAEVFDFEVDGVRVTLLPTSSSRADKAPNPREGAMYIDLATTVLDRFRPEILLTYGGHPVSRSLMLKARARGTAVAFHLHNFGYNDRRAFEDVDAIIFPSEYSRRLYTRRVGIDGVVVPDPIQLDRVIAENPEPANCTPASGVVPTAPEVAPWVAVIERLWDDPEFEAEHRRRALAEAERWDGEQLAGRYEEFLLAVARGDDTRAPVHS